MKDTDKCFEVAEKFVSINGEGPLAGEPAVFIRFKGCNLACAYCDTKWASQPDTPAESMSAQDILQTNDVIAAVNGTHTDNLKELRSVLYDCASGQELSLTIIRDGSQMDVSVIAE